MRFLVAFMRTLALVLALASPALADVIYPLNTTSDALDLGAIRKGISDNRTNITLQGLTDAGAATLQATGKRTPHYWSIYSLQNSDSQPLDFIVVMEAQRFAGSGLMGFRPWGQQALSATAIKGGKALPIITIDGTQAIQLHLQPSEIVNLAIETTGAGLSASLWQPATFQANSARLAYFNGMLEGILSMLVFALIIFWLMHHGRPELAGSCFGFAIWLFYESASGNLASRFGIDSWLGATFNALAESLLAAATAATMAFVARQFPQRIPRRPFIIAVSVLALANIMLGLYAPEVAGLIARIAFVALVGWSAFLVFFRQDNAGQVSLGSRAFWMVLAFWTIFAMFVASIQDFLVEFNALLGLISIVLLMMLLLVMSRRAWHRSALAKPTAIPKPAAPMPAKPSLPASALDRPAPARPLPPQGTPKPAAAASLPPLPKAKPAEALPHKPAKMAAHPQSDTLRKDLHGVIGRNELRLLYQPIVNLTTNEAIGFEALARWRHPKLGEIGPEVFIPLAEEEKLMPEIGDHILSEAVLQLGVWQRIHGTGKPFFLSVNVSPTQFQQADFGDTLQKLIVREKVATEGLILEVTENAIAADPAAVNTQLKALRKMGLGLACDDFGTGFSNLAALRDMPFDTLKLDKSFLRGDFSDTRNAKLVESIIAMAAKLDLILMAEGVETKAQAEKLVKWGVACGQGFLFGQPESASFASARLALLNAAKPKATKPFSLYAEDGDAGSRAG